MREGTHAHNLCLITRRNPFYFLDQTGNVSFLNSNHDFFYEKAPNSSCNSRTLAIMMLVSLLQQYYLSPRVFHFFLLERSIHISLKIFLPPTCFQHNFALHLGENVQTTCLDLIVWSINPTFNLEMFINLFIYGDIQLGWFMT